MMPAIEERARLESSASVEELEQLWRASPDGSAGRERRLRLLADGFTRRAGRIVLWGWLALLASALVLEPAPEPNAVVPAWAVALVSAFWLSLVLAAVLGAIHGTRAGLALSSVAGALGVAAAYACSATAHHSGSFWMYELTGAAVLTAASVAGLLRRR